MRSDESGIPGGTACSFVLSKVIFAFVVLLRKKHFPAPDQIEQRRGVGRRCPLTGGLSHCCMRTLPASGRASP